MIRKIISLLLIIIALTVILTGCGDKKTLHCDRCGREVEVSADSNMNESWTVYCRQCEKDLGLETVIGEN